MALTLRMPQNGLDWSYLDALLLAGGLGRNLP